MKRLNVGPVIAAAVFVAAILLVIGYGTTVSGQTTVQQQHSFGTIAKGSTVCTGPLSPGTGSPGVQIFGFTNASTAMTWQVLAVSSQSAPVVVFQTTARSVDQTIPPSGNFLFEACVVKDARSAQDFDLTLNSSPIE